MSEPGDQMETTDLTHVPGPEDPKADAEPAELAPISVRFDREPREVEDALSHEYGLVGPHVVRKERREDEDLHAELRRKRRPQCSSIRMPQRKGEKSRAPR